MKAALTGKFERSNRRMEWIDLFNQLAWAETVEDSDVPENANDYYEQAKGLI
ncbi:MAG: hypothetical protein HDS59_00565 [Barnesiella sp.]|nr:hypothetical protein [Barnesiella sp.]